MAELFALGPDNRLEDLRNWIKYQWAFKSWYCFWPTEKQILQIADWFKVLCETVMNECDAEFIRHCDKHGEQEQPR
jgi:hypothetical protein